ncbi:Nup93/Nic96-domain-containing protein [Blastocladiella britannica]|nr:Nup93/Nic96-domain-containing protein [Blastocladiella britannica]
MEAQSQQAPVPAQAPTLDQLLLHSRQLESSIAPAGSAKDYLVRPLDLVAQRTQLLNQRSARELALRTTGPHAASLLQSTQSFLAQSGYDANQVQRQLERIDTTRTLAPLAAPDNVDVGAFLANAHDTLVLTRLEATHHAALHDAAAVAETARGIDWEQTKRMLFPSLNLGAVNSGTSTPLSSRRPTDASSSFYGDSSGRTMATGSGSGSEPLDAKTLGYLQAVTRINTATGRIDVFGEMRTATGASAASASSGQYQQSDLGALWDVLAAAANSGSALPRAYADYALEGASTENASAGAPDIVARSAKVLTDVVARTRSHLESTFYDFVEDSVKRHPALALAGGDPSPVRRVIGFVRIRHLKAGYFDVPYAEMAPVEARGEVPLWAVVYYLMRAGKAADAYEFLAHGAVAAALHENDRYVYKYVEQWANNDIPEGGELHSNLQGYYEQLKAASELAADWERSAGAAVAQQQQQQRMQGQEFFHSDAMMDDGSSRFMSSTNSAAASPPGVDPYKLAVIKLLGRCDLADKKLPPAVVAATEDWLWVRMVLASPNGPYQLSHFQMDVRALEAHFGQPSMTSSLSSAANTASRFGGRSFLEAGTMQAGSSSMMDGPAAVAPSPLKYAIVLATAGLFESCVSHLARHGRLADAVHVALALHVYGLLRIPTNPDDVVRMAVDPAKVATAVPLHVLVGQYLGSTSNGTGGGPQLSSDAALQYWVRLAYYGVHSHSGGSTTVTAGTSSAMHHPQPVPGSLPSVFAAWRDYALHRLRTDWLPTVPRTRPLALPARALAMLGLESLDAFHAVVTLPAAETAAAADRLDDALYYYAQARDAASVLESVIALLSRVIVHGAGMLSLGAPAMAAASMLSMQASTTIGGTAGAAYYDDGDNQQQQQQQHRLTDKKVLELCKHVLVEFSGDQLAKYAKDGEQAPAAAPGLARPLADLDRIYESAEALYGVLEIKQLAGEGDAAGALRRVLLESGSSSNMNGGMSVGGGGAALVPLMPPRIGAVAAATSTYHAMTGGTGGAWDHGDEDAVVAALHRIRALPLVAQPAVPVALRLVMDVVVRAGCAEVRAVRNSSTNSGGNSMADAHDPRRVLTGMGSASVNATVSETLVLEMYHDLARQVRQLAGRVSVKMDMSVHQALAAREQDLQ